MRGSKKLSEYPNLMKEWDYEKNEINPEQVAAGSGRKVWWKCKNGHSWEAYISNRRKGNGCPYCSGRIVIPGINDLQTLRPDLIEEWDWSKNDIMPNQVKVHSIKSVWWLCSQGHSWEATVRARSDGAKCPYCNNKKLLKGFNDLETHNPELLKEWDYEKNTVRPSDVVYGAKRKVWWKCDKGHSWESEIYTRTKREKTHCPYCIGKRVLKGFNDLATKNPEVAKQWDYEKNDISPTEVTKWSTRRAWWKCEKGHSWEATVLNRSAGNGCPYCSGKAILVGENDLMTLKPELAKEWDYEKNVILPSQVTIGSHREVWWKCEKGHSWKRPISDRGIGGNGCPYCASHTVLAGFNDFQTLRPELVEEWDFEKNTLLPSEVTVKSGKRVWWKCKKGHSWDVEVSKRSSGVGCPYCAGKRAIQGENDLETIFPELAEEWDYDKNTILPSEVTKYSAKRVWWKCKKGHSWEEKIASRSSNALGCPYCSGHRVITGVNDLQTLLPDIAKEWDYEKNTLTPAEVSVASGRYAWWKCEKGHSWRTIISVRGYGGSGCPYCLGRVPYIPKCVY